MKEKNQIEEALLLHLTKGKSCKGCAYDGGGCLERLHEDVYTLIKSQSAKIESLTAENAELKRRLGAAVDDLKALTDLWRICFACKWQNERGGCSHPHPEILCDNDENPNKWEWRGAQGEG